MDTILRIIQKKPAGIIIVHLIYFLLIGFAKWQLSPSFPTLYFFIGAVLGMYLLNIAEELFNLSPSPFRSILFVVGFVFVSFFVVTSTGSMVGTGVVFSLYLTLILWQLAEWNERGNLSRWYSMVAVAVTPDIQRLILGGFVLLFIVETFLFLR